MCSRRAAHTNIGRIGRVRQDGHAHHESERRQQLHRALHGLGNTKGRETPQRSLSRRRAHT